MQKRKQQKRNLRKKLEARNNGESVFPMRQEIMAGLKAKDIQKMSKTERETKLKELKTELIKNKVSSSKQGSSKAKEIRKMIARINTINNQKPTEVSKK